MTTGRLVRSAMAGAAALPVWMCGNARADVIDESHARNLVGGIFSVTFAVQTGPSSFVVFNEGTRITRGAAPDSAWAETSGVFEWFGENYAWGFRFSLQGSTTTEPWTLSHTGPDGRVFAMSSILYTPPTRGGAVFDNGGLPSTPGSGPGTPQGVTVSGPVIINTGWDPAFLWNGPVNTGDLYTSTLVQWAELSNHRIFGPGVTARWILDTDTVPPPGVPATMSVLIGLGWHRRRRHKPIRA
jgi:hypothetical protein